MDLLGDDIIIHDLPDGCIAIKNPSTNRTVTIKDKKLLGPLDLLIQDNKLRAFSGSLHSEGLRISRETEDSLRITVDDSYVIAKDADVVKVYIAIVNCVED
jgi:hypothetical protein